MDWFSDDAFWRDFFPYMFPSERFAASGEQVEQILRLTGCEKGAVLDLCCGPGRHSIVFAQRGFAVTGVDASPFLLGYARERGLETAVNVEWVLEDMRHFGRASAFDLACSMFTSFGYFEDDEDNVRVLRNVHESLKHGGAFVMEMLGKERLLRVWQQAVCTDNPDGSLLLQRHKMRDGCGRIDNEWIILKDGSYRTFHFNHAVYSGMEIEDRLKRAGFADVRLYGDLQGAPYGLEAVRLVAVARK